MRARLLPAGEADAVEFVAIERTVEGVQRPHLLQRRGTRVDGRAGADPRRRVGRLDRAPPRTASRE